MWNSLRQQFLGVVGLDATALFSSQSKWDSLMLHDRCSGGKLDVCDFEASGGVTFE